MNVEGKNAVAEALKSDATIDVIMVEKGINHPIIAIARDKGIKLRFLDKNTMDKMSVTKRHQGFIAVTSDFEYCDVSDILDYAKSRNEDAFVVLLDGVEDPHNLGSVIRVCECAGVHGVIIPKHRSASVNETVVKVSAGATEHMRVARVTNINSAIEELQKAGVWVFCADMDGQPWCSTDMGGPIGIVVGAEGSGVSRLTKEHCDFVVSLPMNGQVNSLNASVAAAIVIYEAVRQRNGLPSFHKK